MAHDPAAAPYLEQIIRAYREFYPSLSGIWWDYEFKPFPTGIMRYPAFSEKSIRDFARRHQIKEPLTDLLIRRKYHDQWIDFSCEAVAGMFKSVGLAASKQGLPLYVYSGYQGDPVCKTAYNIDWALAGRYVDRAYCGYGLNRESIAMTRKSVKSGVLVGGLLKMGKAFSATRRRQSSAWHWSAAAVSCSGMKTVSTEAHCLRSPPHRVSWRTRRISFFTAGAAMNGSMPQGIRKTYRRI